MKSLIPQFIIEDSRLSDATVIYLSYPALGPDGLEYPILLPLDCISVSDNQEENHKIAIEQAQKIKHAIMISTSQIIGGEKKSVD